MAPPFFGSFLYQWASDSLRTFTAIFLFLALLASAAEPLRVDIQMDQKEIYVNMPVSFTISVSNESRKPITIAWPTTLFTHAGDCYGCLFLIRIDQEGKEHSDATYPWLTYRGLAAHAEFLKKQHYNLDILPGETLKRKMFTGYLLPNDIPLFAKPGIYRLKVKYFPFFERWEDGFYPDNRLSFEKEFSLMVKEASDKDKECWQKLIEFPEWRWPLIYDAYGANFNASLKLLLPIGMEGWEKLVNDYPDSIYRPLIEYQWLLIDARQYESTMSRENLHSRMAALAADPKFVFREPAAAYEKILRKNKRLPQMLNFFAPPFVEPTATEIAAEKRRLAFWVAGLAGSALLLGWGSFRLWRWWKSRPKVVATMRPKSMKFGKAGCWLAFLPWLLLFCCCYWEVDEDISFYFFLIGPLMAFILAIVGLFKDQPRKYAIAALILSSISLWLIWGYMRIMYRFL